MDQSPLSGATTKRKQVYCSLECQYEARSAEYQARPDIKAREAGVIFA
jgi:hypothetical protein